MIISLDNLAYRYGMLPSEALTRGTTFDFRIMEVSSRWETRKRRLEEEPEVVEAEDRTREFGEANLQEMMDTVKNAPMPIVGEGNKKTVNADDLKAMLGDKDANN